MFPFMVHGTLFPELQLTVPDEEVVETLPTRSRGRDGCHGRLTGFSAACVRSTWLKSCMVLA
jgi:hypothetical protein